MQMVNRDNEFKLMDLVRRKPWCRAIRGDYSIYPAGEVGIDTAQLAYFAISVLWRGSIHVWQTFEGRKTGGLQLGPHRETLRSYLAGETTFPREVAVQISASCDWESQNCCMFPAKDPDQESVFNMLTCGIWFDVMLADPLPERATQMCCVASLERADSRGRRRTILKTQAHGLSSHSQDQQETRSSYLNDFRARSTEMAGVQRPTPTPPPQSPLSPPPPSSPNTSSPTSPSSSPPPNPAR